MPYIEKRRMELRAYLAPIMKVSESLTDGELNFVITNLLLSTYPESYSDYNSLIGVLECVQLELYRRRIAKYEDKKKNENGDVY